MPTLNQLAGEKNDLGVLESLETGFVEGVRRSSVAGLYRYLVRPEFDPVDGYDPIEDVKTRYPDLYQRYMGSFAASVSPLETDYIANKLREYEDSIKVLSAAGSMGFIGAFASGLVDPVSYIPLFGAAKKAYNVKKLADLAKVIASTSMQFGAAAAASTALGAIDRPEAQPMKEVPESFAYGAAVGAIVGSAAGAFRLGRFKLEEKAIANKVEDTLDELNKGGAHRAAFESKIEEGLKPREAAREAYSEVLKKRAEQENSPHIYAESPEEAVSKTVDPIEVSKQGLLRGPLGRSLVWLDSFVNPVVAVAESSFESARKIQGLIADAGLVWKATAEGKVVAPMNTVENRIHGYHYGVLAELLDSTNYAYGQWLANKESRAFSTEFADTASSILGVVGKKDLTKQTFSQVALREYALGKGYSSKATQMVGDSIEKFFGWFARELTSVGVVDKKNLVPQNKHGQPYIPFITDNDKIVTHSNEFLDDVIPYVADDYLERIQKLSDREKKKLKDLVQLRDDLSSENLVDRAKNIYADLENTRERVFSTLNERYREFEQITGLPLTENLVSKFGKNELKDLRRVIKKYVSEGNLNKDVSGLNKEEIAVLTAKETRDRFAKAKEIVEHIRNNDEDYLKYRKYRNSQLRRLKQLSRYMKAPPVKSAKAKEKIEKGIDFERAANIFYRYSSRLKKLLEFKENKITDKKRLETGINRALEAIDRYHQTLKELKKKSGDDNLVKEYRVWRKLDNAVKRLSDKLGKVKDLNEFFDSPEWKKIEEDIDSLVNEATDKVLRIGEEYGKNVGKLENVRIKVPEGELKKINEEIERINEILQDIPPELISDVLKGTDSPSVYESVREYIKDVVISNIRKDGSGINTVLRLALQKERGSELVRTLFRSVPNEVMIKYIYNDVESMARSYIRTVAPDIELKRTFGTVQIQKILEPVKKELSKKIDKLPDGPEKKKLKEENDRVYRLLEIQLQRLRGTRSVVARGGHVTGWDKISEILINTAIGAKLGSVLFPSMGDMGKMGMKAGQMKFVVGAFRSIKSKFTKDGFDYTKAALQYGVSERLTAMRMRHMYQLYESNVPSDGKILNFSRWGANKTIKLSLMPMWNQFAKEVSIATTMAAFNPMIKKMAEQGAGAIPKKMRDILLQNGIDENMAKRIMDQVKKDPETWWHVDDYDWSPNIDNWTDMEARMTYQAFISGEYNRSVVTPGLEKPEWADGSNIGKMAYQFRGYLFSSTSKLFLAGLQHPDLSLAATYALSILLGGLQLYARAFIIGGSYWDRVRKWSSAKWIDMAIDQGAPIGILTEINKLAMIAGIPYGTLQYWLEGSSGQRSKYYTREDLSKLVLGPSLPMFLYDGVPLAIKFKDAAFGDAEIKARDIHKLRGLMWGNTIFYLSWAYDMLENTINDMFDIPER